MTLLTENVPEGDRVAEKLEIAEFELLDARIKFGIIGAGLADAGEVAFHISSENGDANAAECFRHYLERDRLTGAGRTSDQPVPVCHRGQQDQIFCTFCNDEGGNHESDFSRGNWNRHGPTR